ncbi:hypothetical protein BGZ73_006453 [Actinomortierella ambigua]|nr:hypothetical protein BGZ73_006453 [Actinomortierella ambigua]
MTCGPTQGSCGPGQCCSKDGFCGDSPLHCGDGCQVGFGQCNGLSTVTPSSGPNPTEPPLTATTEPALPSPTTAPFTESPPTATTDIPSPTPTPTVPLSGLAPTPSAATKGTYQFQPTGRPSGATPSRQDTSSVHSRIALVVVILASLLWI